MAPMTPAERFMSKVRRPGKLACWEWQGAVTQDNVGILTVNGYSTTAARYSYELHFGPVPKGMHVARQPSCSSRCVNPSHLLLQSPGRKLANRKLTDNDIRELRQLREEGKTYEELAKEYAISVTTAWRICQRKLYARVE